MAVRPVIKGEGNRPGLQLPLHHQQESRDEEEKEEDGAGEEHFFSNQDGANRNQMGSALRPRERESAPCLRHTVHSSPVRR